MDTEDSLLEEASDLRLLLEHISNQNQGGGFSFGVDWSLLRNFPYLQDELLCPLLIRLGSGVSGREYCFGSSMIRDHERVKDILALVTLEVAARQCFKDSNDRS